MASRILEGDLAAFFADVQTLKSALETKPAALMSASRQVDDDFIQRFARDLERLRPLLPESAPLAPVTSEVLLEPLSLETLRRMDMEFCDVEAAITREVDRRWHEVRQAWPEDPRLSTQSLLGPLGIRNVEVRITSALAWCLKPSGKSEALRDRLLAATVQWILEEDKPVDASEVACWRVDAEHQVESCEGDGRIDIVLDGVLRSAHYRIAIEAKVHAKEGKNQLPKYHEGLKSRSAGAANTSSTHVVFLTIDGRASGTATPMAFSELFAAWSPVCKEFATDVDAPFVRLLLADISRDLTDGHLAGGPWELGMYIPRFSRPKAQDEHA